MDGVDNMQRLLWFPLYIDHFLGSRKVLRMTIGEQGAYLRLLCFAWSGKDCGLPNDLQELKELALWTDKTEGDFIKVRACFTPHPENRRRIHNARLYEEWKKVEELKGRRKEAAQLRWSKPATPEQPIQKLRKPSSGFESVAAIADKHFKPI